ncbi:MULTISPECIES: PqiC family protein [Pacificibacter]|uniref:PqiC family protein n=1 Tax=Pacificibacter TaxID=1042323 RepID=UPI001C0A3693|nr:MULTISPECIES: ABC-type transport auxiliary lipoprotein family protein [Pacificibacter]MBU2936673.1 PqiC family protein [Pacificibacter marinus]MDO6614525.1 ABC-type transport auxiliary lipoprotein family protein [Pacificibacter sp. 1_MG-2023]
MTLFKAALVGATLVLASCGAAPDRYTVTAPVVTEKLRIGFSAVEVSDVSLPTYAAADEIVVQDATGKLVPSGAALWADTPERSVALELTRNLAKLTNARVASEPWPFEAFPDARLDVRFESLVAQADGQFRATGQYFVGVTDERRERSGLFDLTVPFDTTGGPQAVAQARGQIILDLATYIASKGLK